MASAAVIVGIDDYVTKRLTSAVNDARAFKRALLRLGLVAEENVRLLTAPARRKADLPTRKKILDELQLFAAEAKSVDRLFFYFAGHGMLAFSDADQALTRTALLPLDFRSFEQDRDVPIDFEAVVARLRMAGPAEQFFFVDACRDLHYEERPGVSSSLGWAPSQPGPEQAQAVLYAVPPLGAAEGERDGMGRMTSHLIAALEGRGIALDYSQDRRAYVVTPESVTEYVRARLLETIGHVPLWKLKYSLPRLNHPEPHTEPIRVVPAPADIKLTVRVDPPAARGQTNVRLTQMDFQVYSWPPYRYGRPSPVKPRPYWLEVDSEAGIPDPDRQPLDAREQRDALITIRPVDEQAMEEPSSGAGPSPPQIGMTRSADASSTKGLVRATAREPQVAIELKRLDPPYTSWRASGRLVELVPPGDYRIRFRLGRDVFSEGQIQVEQGKEVVASPTIGASPLLRAMHATETLTLAEPTQLEQQMVAARTVIRGGLPDGQP